MDNSGITRRDALKLGGTAAVAGAMLSASIGTAMAQETASTGDVLFENPGAYSATATGRCGQITLTCTFSESAIEDIAIEDTETLTIGEQGLAILRDEVLANQSIAVDAVTGATISSAAFTKALGDCIKQAGGVTEALSAEIPAQTIDYVTDADVIVVGAGGTGLAAALTAAEAGASVIVIEKSGIFGGNSNAAQNGLLAAGSDIQKQLGANENVQDFIDQQMNNDLVHEDLVMTWIDNSAEAADWYVSLGAEFSFDESFPLMLNDIQENAVTSESLIYLLYTHLNDESGVSMYADIAAEDLIVDDNGAVIGVAATDKQGVTTEFSAKSIVLASGGFGRNNTLVSMYMPSLSKSISDEIAPTTGDGLLMAQRIRAAVTDLDQLQLHTRCVPGFGMFYTTDNGQLLVGDGHGTPQAPAGIYVNDAGQRVGSEYDFTNDMVLSQDNGLLYHIFPADCSIPFTDTMYGAGFAKVADTAEELGEQLGIDGAALQETVDAWNADVANGGDQQFGRTDVGVVALDGPLMAYAFGIAIHYCMGGVLVNTENQVLDINGDPIDGLYAAGEVTGGLHGTTRSRGSAISDSLINGRTAGKSAAAAALA